MNYLETFKNYLQASQKASPATVKNYLADIRKFQNWIEEKTNETFAANLVSEAQIEEFKADMAKLSVNSADRYVSSLRKFYAYLESESLITTNPFSQIISQPVQDTYFLKGFKNSLYEGKASDVTIKNYLIDIKQFIEWMEEVTADKQTYIVSDNNIFTKLTTQMIEEYKKRLHHTAHLSPLSINRKLSSIRKYLSFLLNQGVITNVPFVINEREHEHETATTSTDESQLPIEPILPVKTEDTHAFHEKKQYSSFGPLRLFQRIGHAGNFLFDLALILPLVKFIEHAQYLFVKLSGKGVFQASHAHIQGATLAGRATVKALNGLEGIISSRAKQSSVRGIHHFVTKDKTTLADFGFRVSNLPKEMYAPISVKNLPFHKQVVHHLRFTRPDWYRKYHSYAITHYFHFAIMMIVVTALGVGVYNGVFNKAKQTQTLAALPTAPPRILSFQGRLTDNSDNPITANSNLRFAIYSDPTASGGALLWQEVKTVSPDTDGIFNAYLGQGTAIPSTLFAQNAALYLGITVGTNDTELTPRQQIATVAFATNSETLQGLPPSTAAGAGQTNVVLALDSSGNLTLGGSASPTFQASGGQFTVAGTVVRLTTNTGTNSNIQLAPDGTGKIDVQKAFVNSTLFSQLPSAAGAVNVDDLFAVNATSSGQSLVTLNQNGTGPLISASTSGAAKFTVNNDGSGYFDGRLLVKSGTSAVNNAELSVNGQVRASQINVRPVANGDNIFTGIQQQGATNTLDFYAGNVQAASLTQSGNLGLGSTAPAYKLDVSGGTGIVGQFSGRVIGGNAVNSNEFATLGQITGGLGNLWQLNAGALSPANPSNDVLVGGTATASALIKLGGTANASSFFNTGGNVGIGTTNPAQKLHVVGSNVRFDSDLIFQKGSATNIFTNDAQSLNFGANGTANYMTLNTSGNLGVGTTNPASRFHVVSGLADATAVRISDNSNYTLGAGYGAPGVALFGGLTGSQLALQANGAERMRIDSNGNLGIGTTSVGSKLQVNGNTALGYATSTAAPTNGLAVAGNVGIGTTTATEALEVVGDIKQNNTRNRTMTRTVPTTVNDAVDIGSFALTNGGGSLWVSITVPSGGFSVAKEYTLPIQYSQTAGAWTIALPTSSTGAYSGQDFALDVNINGATASLRIRRTTGTTAGTAYIVIQQDGVNTDTFTASTTTTSVAAPPTYFTSTALTQVGGNVGIGTTSPTSSLEVATSFLGSTTIGASTRANTFTVRSTVGGGGAGTIGSGGIINLAGDGLTSNINFATLAGVRENSTGDRGYFAISTNGTGISSGYTERVRVNSNGTFIVNSLSDNVASIVALQIKGSVSQTGDLTQWTNNSGTPLSVINASGNIGIGSTLPAYKLDVSGGTGIVGQFSGRVIGGNAVNSNEFVTLSQLTGGTGQYWQRFNGALSPTNITDDVLIGSTATASALVKLGGTSGASTFFNTGGNVGIGSTNPQALLDINKSNLLSGRAVGIQATQTAVNTTDLSDSGLSVNYTLSASSASNQLVSRGLNFSVNNNLTGGGAISNLRAFNLAAATQTGTSTTNLDTIYIESGSANGTVTNARGLYISSLQGTSRAGLVVSPLGGTNSTLALLGQSTIPSGNYGIYNSSAFDNYIGGNVGIGSTAPTNKLQVTGTTTGNALVGLNQATAGADIFTASASGTSRFVITNSGNVGIGTSLPGNPLDVFNGGNETALFRSSSTAETQVGISNTSTGGRRYMLISAGQTPTAGVPTGNFGIRDYTAGAVRLVIDTNGNVGIGSTSPAYKLDVQGGTGIVGQFSGRVIGGDAVNSNEFATLGQIAGGAGQFWKLTNGALSPTNPTNDVLVGGNATGSALIRFGGTTNADSFFNTGGNVGIGTTTPLTKFYVKGQGTAYTDKVFSVVNSSGTSAFITTGDGRTFIGGDNGVNGVLNVNFAGAKTSGTLATFTDASSNTLSINATNIGNNTTVLGLGTANYNSAFNITNASANYVLNIAGDSVGIGSTAPTNKLQVTGTTTGNALVGLNQTTAGADIFTASASGTTRFVIQNNGNVGIGTTIAGAGLQVNGAASGIGAILRANATTPGDLLQLQNSGGTTIGKITSTGQFVINNSNSDAAIAGGASMGLGVDGSNNVILRSNGVINLSNSTAVNIPSVLNFVNNTSGTLNVNNASALSITQTNLSGSGAFTSIIKAGGGQSTNDIFQIQNSAAGVLVNANSNGNLGIGSTNPAYKLDVSGGTGIVGQFSGRVIGGNAVNSNEFVTYAQVTGGLGNLWQRFNGALSPTNTTDDVLVGSTATASALIKLSGTSGGNSFINTGNLGIGSTAPGYKLDVVGGVGIGARIGKLVITDDSPFYTGANIFAPSGQLGIGTQGSAAVGIFTNNTEKVRVDAGGNVGVGTTGPIEKLQVTGGNIQIDNNQYIKSKLAAGTPVNILGYDSSNKTIVGANGEINLAGYVALIPGGVEAVRVISGGNVGIGSTAPTNKLQITGGTTGNALVGLNQTTAGADIFTASASGTTRFVVQNNGNIGIGTSLPAQLLDVQGGSGIVAQFSGRVIGGNAVNTNEFATLGQLNSNQYFQRNLGAVAPFNITDDILVGGSATASAKIRLGGTTNADSFFNTGGNVGIGTTSITDRLTVNGNTNLTTGNVYEINGASVLSATTLGTGVVTSSLTTVGALSSGSIASGFGTIATTNTITGTTINGTTGINTGASAGTQRIDASGNLVNIGDITTTGTTGISMSGNGAGITFSGTGNHTISASGGTLQLGAHTLTGAITGGNQNISSIGNITANSSANTITGFGTIGTSGTTAFTGSTLALTGPATGATSYNGLVITANTGVITTGTWNGTAIGPTYGGTGLTSYTTGDMLYASGTNTLATRAIGTTGQVLAVAGGLPTWTDLANLTTNYWQLNAGALSPANTSNDILTGSNATASALIKLGGTPNASSFFNTGGNVGIGTTTTTSRLTVLSTQTSGNTAEIKNTTMTSGTLLNLVPPSSTGITGSSNIINLQTAAFNPGGGNFGDGLRFTLQNFSNNSTGTSTVSGIRISPTSGILLSGSGVAETNGILIGAQSGFIVSGGTINNYGVRIQNQGIANATNAYGLYIDNQSGATNNYSVYSAGSANSYFAGNIGIGSASPAQKLDVSGNIALTGSIAAATSNTINGLNINAGAISGATGLVSSGNIDLSSLSAGGIVKAAPSTGRLSIATSGTDYEAGLTFSNGLTRTVNTITLGGALTSNTDIALSGFNFTLSGTGNVGIGTTSPTTGKFVVTNTDTATSGFTAMTYNELFANPSGTTTETYIGARNIAQMKSGNTQNATGASIIGLYNQAIQNGSNTVGNAYALQAHNELGSTGTITESNNLHISTKLAAAGTITNQRGIYIENPFNPGGGTLGTNYGIYMDNQTTGGTDYGLYITGADDYAIYSGGGKNYFSGNVGIGSTTPSSFKVEVAGSIGPSTTNTYDLGSLTKQWNNVYASNFYSNGNPLTQFWQRNAGALSPANITDDLLLGGTATGSARVRIGATPNADSFFNTGGNVAIGLSSIDTVNFPGTKLQLSGDLTIDDNTDGYSFINLDRFSSAFNTGIRFSSAANAEFRVQVMGSPARLSMTDGNGASEYLTVQTGGNIGIGTTASNSKFQINGNAAIGYSTATAAPTNGLLVAGNVGIGTSSPLSALHVSASTPVAAIINQNGAVTNDIFTASASGATRFTIRNDGNVGVGTTLPTDKMVVNGNVSASQFKDFDNTAYYMDPANATTSLLVNGNVGIGMSSAPATKLQIQSTTADTQLYIGSVSPSIKLGNNAAAGSATANLLLAQSTVAGNYGLANAGDTLLANYGASRGNLYINSNYSGAGTTNVYIQPSTGNIGIGTTTTTRKLSLGTTGSTDTYMSFNSASGAVERWVLGSEASAGRFVLYGGDGTTQNYRLSVLNNGNVGIGSVTPGAKLDIAGNAAISTSLAVGTTATVNGEYIYSNYAAQAAHTAIGYMGNLLGVGVKGISQYYGNYTYPGRADGVAAWNTGWYLGSHASYGLYTNTGFYSAANIWAAADVRTPILYDLNDTGYYVDPNGTSLMNFLYVYQNSFGAGGTMSRWFTNMAPVVGAHFAQYCTNGNCGDLKIALGTSGGIGMDGAISSPADYAEFMKVAGDKTTYQKGDLLMHDIAGSAEVDKTSNEYDPNIIGVVSTKPGVLGVLAEDVTKATGMGDKNVPNQEDQTATHIEVGLLGRVPVKVTTKNGELLKGSPITSSSIRGYGMLATKVGRIVGHAQETLTNTEACTPVSSAAAVVWPEDTSGMNPGKPCFVLPDGTRLGKIMVLVSPSWYDPGAYLTNAQSVSIMQNADKFDAYKDNMLVTNIGAFASVVTADLRAGAIDAQKITTGSFAISTENVSIAGQSLKNYILSIVSGANMGGNNNGPELTVQNLKTNLISPLASQSAVVINGRVFIAGNPASNQPSLEVAGNASISGQLSTTKLNATDASISGTLRAGRIIADDIEGLNARIASLSANTVTASSAAITNITNITNVYNSASSSAQTASGSGQINPEYQNGIASLTASSIQSTYANIATLSAAFGSVPNLNSDFGQFNQGLMSLGATSLSDTSVTGQLSVNGNMILADNTINVLGADLQIQPLRQGGVSFEGGLVAINTEGDLTVGGNAVFNRDVTIRGTLATNIISPVPGTDLIIRLGTDVADPSKDGIFQIQNASGSGVLAIDQKGNVTASGSGFFQGIASNLFNVVRGAQADTSVTETTASASAGTATIQKFYTERTIYSPYVSEKSLIYVTATSNTQGQTPYIARQTAEDKVSGTKGSFTIQIPTTVSQDIKINWWIVN